MKYVVLHESERSMRISIPTINMTCRQADLLEYFLKTEKDIREAKVYDRTSDAVIRFHGTLDEKKRERLKAALAAFSYEDERLNALVPESDSRALGHEYEGRMMDLVVGRILRNIFLPTPINTVITIISSVRFLWKGIRSLASGHLQVPVLDATAITVSMLRGDFKTASSVMFLLTLGDLLEEWTKRRAAADLADSMSLQVDKVWVKTESGEVLMGVNEVQKGDHIVLRTSNIIPLDGKVLDGEATVNQSSMTGESVPVEKHQGGYVYAGTVVEEGEITVEVAKAAGSGKYDQIVKMIEDSEKLKSATEEKAFHLADRLVPYALAGTAVTWLLTRNVNRALSFLMVDFSCALKLSMPLTVLTAIKEAGKRDMVVKGGKFLEAVAKADTIVFDKTGTLTYATPTLEQVVTFDDMDRTEALRIAACLEEHYPHSMANAVVNAAAKQGITHDEMHSKVEYVVAHGIASSIEGKRALIGSYHFVFEDEKCVIPEGEETKLKRIPKKYSRLFLSIDGRLKAVLCIFDPPRKEAAEVINELHRSGFTDVCMMTGDNKKTAEALAAELSLDRFEAEVLPEDKAAFIRAQRKEGHTVIMVGDGVNDAPALSEADVGIAVNSGAAIAREIADITINGDSLYTILELRKIAKAMMDRIHSNYRFILGFNGTLIALGVLGILLPSVSAMLHNGSTIITGLRSLTPLLPEKEEEERLEEEALKGD